MNPQPMKFTIIMAWRHEEQAHVKARTITQTSSVSTHIRDMILEWDHLGSDIDTSVSILTTEGSHNYVYAWEVKNGNVSYLERCEVIQQ